MEHPPYTPDLASNDFCPFPKINSAFKVWRFQDTEDIQKENCDDVTESCRTTGIPKMFPAVAVSLG
jgi:hypothetical protein